MSSSAGTLVALPLVDREPALFDAWVACDLNVGFRSEETAMPATVAWVREHGRRRDRRLLDDIPPDPRARTHDQFEQLMRVRDRAAGPLGVSRAFMPALQRLALRSPLDLVAVIRGLGFSSELLFSEMRAFDARLVSRLRVPLFVVQGEFDPFTPPAAAREYFELVEAPTKDFVLVPGGGHVAAFREPGALLDLLLQRVMPAIGGERS